MFLLILTTHQHRKHNCKRFSDSTVQLLQTTGLKLEKQTYIITKLIQVMQDLFISSSIVEMLGNTVPLKYNKCLMQISFNRVPLNGTFQ